MEKVKVTIEQVINFRSNAERYISNRPGVFSQFIWALNKGLKNTKKAYEDYLEKYNESRFQLASTDEKKIIVRDGNDFAFTADNRIKLNNKNTELIEQTVEIEPYYAKDIPEDVTVTFLEVMCPFVVTEEDIENMFNAYEEKIKNPQKELIQQ